MKRRSFLHLIASSVVLPTMMVMPKRASSSEELDKVLGGFDRQIRSTL